jgi:hypothetical protein
MNHGAAVNLRGTYIVCCPHRIGDLLESTARPREEKVGGRINLEGERDWTEGVKTLKARRYNSIAKKKTFRLGGMKAYFWWIESVFATGTDHTSSNIISRDNLNMWMHS